MADQTSELSAANYCRPQTTSSAHQTSPLPADPEISVVLNLSEQPQLPATKKECSMCGDTGIYEDLFLCTWCHCRYQHIYCSRSYPNLGSEKWVCNWCLHEDDKLQQEKELKKQIDLKRKAEDVGEGSHNIFRSLQENGSQEHKIQGPNDQPKQSDITGTQKRHRCNHAAEKNSSVLALGRWKHIAKSNRLQLNSSKGIGRRYKLLADVLC